MTAGSEPATGAGPAKPAGAPGNFGDLKVRIASAIVIIVVSVAALVVGGAPFTLFWLAAGVAIHWEWQNLVVTDQPRARFILGAAFLSVAAAFAAQLAPDFAIFVVACGALVVALLAGRGMRLWAGAGVVYAGALVLSICAIRPPLPELIDSPLNLRAILWLFAVVWGTDIMAYFGGRLIGGPKLWPRVSAGKTWSGTLVGVASGAVLGLAVASFHATTPVAVLPMLVIGLCGGAAAQAGDLFESSIKRRFGVKDSSHLIPGHGGVMDRLDGFVAAALLVWIIGAVRATPTIAEGLFLWP